MESVGVQEAANHLGVSAKQVGRLIAQHDLQATRFGRAWAIDRASLQRYAAARPARGRPLTPTAAWRLLATATPQSLSEARALANRVRRRGERHMSRVAPGLVGDLLDDPRVTVGGGDAVLSHSAIAKPTAHVVYVKATELQGVIADFFAVTDANEPNVIIYAVDDIVWPDNRAVRAAVAIVDLIDQGDLRSASEVLKEFT